MDTLCLSHHFLIAMPDMEDSLFARAVVYMCDHGEQGAMGVIINHGADLTLDSLLGQIGLDGCRPDQVGLPVFVGGPVQSDRGFVLHEPIGNWQSSLTVTDNVALTAFWLRPFDGGMMQNPNRLELMTADPVIGTYIRTSVWITAVMPSSPSAAQRVPRPRTSNSGSRCSAYAPA